MKAKVRVKARGSPWDHKLEFLPEYRKGWGSNPVLTYRSVWIPKKIEFLILAGLLYKIHHATWEGMRFWIETFWLKHLKILNPYIPLNPGLLSSFPSCFRQCKEALVCRQCREDSSLQKRHLHVLPTLLPSLSLLPIYPCAPPKQ